MDILILEDEWLIAESLKDDIEVLGHRGLGPVSTCQEALELIHRARPDLAVLDAQLRGETCEAVYRECLHLGLPMIISSGHSPEGLPEFIERDSVILSKPYGEHDLGNAIAAAMRSGT